MRGGIVLLLSWLPPLLLVWLLPPLLWLLLPLLLLLRVLLRHWGPYTS